MGNAAAMSSPGGVADIGRYAARNAKFCAMRSLQSNEVEDCLHVEIVMTQIDRVLRSNLKLKHLQLLVALDQFRHLGRAAEFLSLTQPAVSKTLAEIEKLFGLALFDRSTR